MAAQPTKLFKKLPSKTASESPSLFAKKRLQRGVNWTDINWENFLLLLAASIRENIGVGIFSASGGRGICLKLYRGKKLPDVEYADTAEEFDELVAGVLANLGEIEEGVEEADAAD
jgi:hypothetical protein